VKVLVTGATGFVGGHLVQRLLARGDQVTALVRSTARAAPLAARGVTLVEGNLANTAALHRATTDQDIVYHAAAVLGASTEAELMAANHDGTRRLAEACVAAGRAARFVMVSSMAAGGPAQPGAPKRGAGDDRPVTMYGRSKLAAEVALREMPLRWTVLRPSVVYGPGDREGLLPLFKAARWGIAPMFGDGSMEVSLVHVGDLADALVLAGVAPHLESQVYYINHPEVLTGRGISQAVGLAMGKSVWLVPLPEWAAQATLQITGLWADLTRQKSILHPDKIHEFYQPAWTADPTPFMHATAWMPQWDLTHGLDDTMRWYRAEHWL
jgi:nucleoside-diphosphate-sugar epimerase